MEKQNKVVEKKEWVAPVLSVLEIETETNGQPSGTLSGDALGYS